MIHPDLCLQVHQTAPAGPPAEPTSAWRACVFSTAIAGTAGLPRLAAVAGLALLAAVCGDHEVCREAESPATLQAETAEQLRAKYHAADAIRLEIDGAALMALVFHECKADYKVVFYKQNGSTFARFGAEFNLLDFEQPRLDTQGAPTIRTRHRPTGEPQFFKITASDVDLLPEKGHWQPIAPGVGALRDKPEKR